ncbi:MAG: Gfo/Idh/MocA family oxidoreductase [Gemmataceae bacterium]|nr:Gfo/Idh/MocA family oxidoreductase [Gemmataceae bacterium]
MAGVKIGVVGVGHLGKEHARILSTLPGVELAGIADPFKAQAEAVALRCNTKSYASHLELMDKVDAVVIAAPTRLHHEIALDFLNRGLSVLVEKPICMDPEKAWELAKLSRQRKATLQVGHIERFNPAFEAVAALPMKPRYIRCERLGVFSGRSSDTGVVLDLMIHDIDLVCSLTKSKLVSTQALGVAVLGGHEDMAQARLVFANGTICDLAASRVHPEPRRRMDLWAAEGYAGIDFIAKQATLMQPGQILRDLAESAPARLDPQLVSSFKSNLFSTQVESKKLDCSKRPGDQLTWELEDFVKAITTGEAPRVNGEAGAHAVEVASRVLDSICGHKWQGEQGPETGPWDIPALQGKMFQALTISKESAA